jgi:hypothetical protein
MVIFLHRLGIFRCKDLQTKICGTLLWQPQSDLISGYPDQILQPFSGKQRHSKGLPAGMPAWAALLLRRKMFATVTNRIICAKCIDTDSTV